LAKGALAVAPEWGWDGLEGLDEAAAAYDDEFLLNEGYFEVAVAAGIVLGTRAAGWVSGLDSE
jgi:hypothetical protein